MRNLFNVSIIKEPKDNIEKFFFENIISFVNSKPMTIEEVRFGVSEIKEKYNLEFKHQKNHIQNTISEIKVSGTIFGFEHVKERHFTIISKNRKYPSLFVRESFFRDSTRDFCYVECKLNGDKENKIPSPYISNNHENIERDLRQLKLEKSQHFEELNKLILKHSKKLLGDYFQFYGEICYNIQIKERELLSLSKNNLED